MNETIKELENNPDFRVLKRVPQTLIPKNNTDTKEFVASIIDLETMGLNAHAHEIIEIGVLNFSFSNKDGILNIVCSYNELNDPGKPIPAEVTKVTKIRDEDVKGKAINWSYVLEMLEQSHVVICHNSGFDRNFLELQTPDFVSNKIKSMPFGCTLKDVDWYEHGFESAKLDYLNFKMGYFYEGHRAINDCWATLNLLIQSNSAFEELKSNIRKKETILCAVNAAFDKKDALKERQYRWSDGMGNLPKCWWICVPNDLLLDEKNWLDETIYSQKGASDKLPQREISAKIRYSFRAEEIEV